MRISWTAVEQAAKLCGWRVKREKGRSVCTLPGGPPYYEHMEYSQEQALLHCLTALLWQGNPPEHIRRNMEWEPAVVRGQGVAVYDWTLESSDASLAAVCSRIWPNDLLDS